jgi:hypothetical protein
MLSWYYNSTKSSYFHSCVSVVYKIELVSTTNTSCYDVLDGQELEDSTWPKQCSSDDDCKLTSGELALCECGLDGSKYCRPPVTSNVFKTYWDTCDASTQTTSLDTKIIWDWSYHFYTSILSGPDCSSDLFYELDIDYLFEYVYSSSAELWSIVALSLLV